MPANFQHPGFRGLVGVARENISPEPGIYARNWGAAKHDAAEGIHRRLFVTALTIQEPAGGDPLVLIDADLGWWRGLDLERRFRQQLLERLGLPEERFLFCLTHTHAAAPLIEKVDPKWEGGDRLGPFFQLVLDSTTDAVEQALESAVLSTIEWETGRCALAQKRDLPENGRRICGFDPNPAEPPDDTLLVGRVSNDDGDVTAVIANYACHPTTLAWENRLISSDFVGMMRRVVQEAEPNALALFLQGASGELAPRHQYTGDVEVADRNGRQLGHAILATLNSMEPPGQQLRFDGVVESGAPLAVWRNRPAEFPGKLSARIVNVELPMKDWPSAEELERQCEAEPDRALRERLRRRAAVRSSVGDGETFSLPVWIWEIGDATVVGQMCEAYSSIQSELRAAAGKGRPLMFMNLANGSLGYLPNEALYGEDVYQVWQTPFDRGSLEILTSGIQSNL